MRLNLIYIPFQQSCPPHWLILKPTYRFIGQGSIIVIHNDRVVDFWHGDDVLSWYAYWLRHSRAPIVDIAAGILCHGSTFFVADNLVLKRGTGVIRVILLMVDEWDTIDSHMQRNNNWSFLKRWDCLCWSAARPSAIQYSDQSFPCVNDVRKHFVSIWSCMFRFFDFQYAP